MFALQNHSFTKGRTLMDAGNLCTSVIYASSALDHCLSFLLYSLLTMKPICDIEYMSQWVVIVAQSVLLQQRFSPTSSTLLQQLLQYVSIMLPALV